MLATAHFLHEQKASYDDFELARSNLYKLGIKMSYDDEKAIFTANHSTKNNNMNIYSQECNGLILERGTWRPLMVPPRSLRYNINTEQANKFLFQGLYHIYYAEDGTCFNMYHYNDQWIISTARGFKMNDMKWEDKSYQDLICECLSKYFNEDNKKILWELFCSKLNKNHCYSFGFKHSSFHKFNERSVNAKGNVENTEEKNNQITANVNKIWFIQSIDLNENSQNYLWTSDKTPIPEINANRQYTEHVSNLRELYFKATNALNDFIETGAICYGFILRSNNFEFTRDSSDLFIESSLLRQIRKIWYENNIIDNCHKNNWNKEKTITLISYLNIDVAPAFIKLFPQYQPQFDKFSEMINAITDKMIVNDSIDNQTITNNTYDEHLTLTAKIFLSNFRASINYNLSGKTPEQKKKIYYEYVLHPNSFELLYNLSLKN